MGLSFAYYLLGVFLLHLYGTRVCPFLENISGTRLLGLLALGFCAGAAVKRLIEPRWVDAAPIRSRAFRQLVLEVAVYVLMGVALGVFVVVWFEFPRASALKLTVGFLTLGLFAGLDVALGRQRAEFGHWSDSTVFESTVSVTRRLMAGFVTTLVLSGLVIVFAVKKDVDFLLGSGATTAQAGRFVMTDVSFTIVVIGALGLRVLASFAGNLRILFDAQLATLAAVESGHLDRYVPVMTTDEFAMIAAQTNRMIDGLREKDRIKGMLGKVVSREVADRLISADTESLRSGQRLELAILFCDLRDFTTLTEKARPEEVVALLNQYFTTMVGCIEAERGVVDKFIGDAVLAVFGLGGEAKPAVAAVRAGLAMVAAADRLVAPGGGRIVNGVGIHFGTVVAGTIGSPDRFEYTVIGDAVNAASRIESACKGLGRRLLASAEAHGQLPPEVARELEPAGDHVVKGRAQPLTLFGAGRLQS